MMKITKKNLATAMLDLAGQENNDNLECDLLYDGGIYIKDLEKHIPQWISVKDKKPAYGVPVLITCKSVTQNVVYTLDASDSSEWFEPYHYNDIESAILSHKVDCWMPLPNPPE